MLRPRRHSRLSRLYSLSRGRERYGYPLRKRFYAEVEEMEKIEQEQEAELLGTLVEAWEEKIGEYVKDFEEFNEQIEEKLKQMSRRAKYSRYDRRRLYAEQGGEEGSSKKNPELEELDKLLEELDMRVGEPDESSNSGVIYKTLRNFAKFILEAGKKAFEDMRNYLTELLIGPGALGLAVGLFFVIVKFGGASLLLGTLMVLGVILAFVVLAITIVLVWSFFYNIAVQVQLLREVRDLALQAIRAKDGKARKKIMQEIAKKEEAYKTAVNEALAKLRKSMASK